MEHLIVPLVCILICALFVWRMLPETRKRDELMAKMTEHIMKAQATTMRDCAMQFADMLNATMKIPAGAAQHGRPKLDTMTDPMLADLEARINSTLHNPRVTVHQEVPDGATETGNAIDSTY